MAMNVKFLQGSSTNFNKITTKEANTFYYVTDKKALYLGANLIGDGVSTEAFEALKTRVKTLEDWKTLLATEASQTSASTTSIPDLIAVTVKTKDGAVSGVSVNDAALRSLISSYVTNVTFNTYKQEQDSRDDGQDSKIAALEETVEGIVSVGGEANLVDDVQINGTTIVAGKVANIAVDGAYSGINKIATMSTVSGAMSTAMSTAQGYTDAEITGLEFALSEDGKTLELKNKAGTAVATLDTSDFVVDGMLTSVVADQANNKLTFTWNTDSGVQETVIELSSIADIYTGSEGAEVKVAVSNKNVISATLADAVKADIAKGVTAHGWDNHATQGYLKAADIASKVDKVAGATVDNIVVFSTASGSQKDSGKSLSDFATAAQGTKADSALQEVTIAGTKLTKTNSTISATDISEAINLTGGADSFEAKIGEAQEAARVAQQTAENVGSNLTHNYKTWDATKTAIQGNTDVTVEQAVIAINKLSTGAESQNATIGSINSNVDAIVDQLTWGTF